MNRNVILWIIIPLALPCLIGVGILALPGLVSSSKHRTTIETLASSITGRKVHIAGKLSLSLFPEPQLIAGNVTIDGNNGETIKSRSLTLDIAMPALLHGQLTASNVVLQSPAIAFPWPLPGGPAAITPPPWLTTLHAQIYHGRISFGALIFSDVSADIFTAAGGAVSISGSGKVLNQPVNITVSLGIPDLLSQAPLAIQVISGDRFLHFTGNFSRANVIIGSLAASQSGQSWLSTDPSQKITLSANINANPSLVSLTNLKLLQGSGTLSGSASLDVNHAKLSLLLSGTNIVFSGGLKPSQMTSLGNMSIHNEIAIDHLTFGSFILPHIDEISDISNHSVSIVSATATLLGGSSAKFSGSINQNGLIKAEARLTAKNLSAFFGNALPDGASVSANLTSAITGTPDHLIIAPVTGMLGSSPINGSAIFSAGSPASLASQFHVKQLDLGSFGLFLKQAASIQNLEGNFEISADRANFGTLDISHLSIDGGFNKNLIIRHMSATLYNGMAVGNLTLQPDGTVTAAHGFLAIPSASPLTSLLPRGFNLPPAVLASPLSLSVSASGGMPALATSAAMTLGQFSISLSPLINLTKQTMSGAVTLRHPSAIAAFKLFGLNAGLPWPGAGSISLRADMNLTSNSFGLPSFILSMGELTAAGSLAITTNGSINGTINADTLALPPLPSDLTAFWNDLPKLNGKVMVTANQVLFAGSKWLGPSVANINLTPGRLILIIGKADFDGGDLSGHLDLAQAAPQPPSVTANFNIAGTDLSKINLPYSFPVMLQKGNASTEININANGFTPQTWAATISGTAKLHAENGTISGFNLSGLAAALKTQNRDAALTAAAETGATDFKTLDITGGFDHGIFTINDSSLQSFAGTATATGSVDISDQDVALNFGLLPKVTPPVNIGLSIIGGWNNPRKVPALKSARAWPNIH